MAAKGNRQEAIVSYQRVVEIYPKSPHAHRNLSVALRRQGKLKEAIAHSRKAIELDPKFGAAYNALGIALFEQKKLGEASAAFRTAIDLDPQNARAHHNLGNGLMGQGKLDEAIVWYRKAIDIDPKFASAHINLGNALRRQGKVGEAIGWYRKAIKLDSKSAAGHNGLGSALYNQEKLDEAVAAFRTAVDLDPKYSIGYSNLGNALRAQGKLDAAIACHRRAIELDPNYAIPHYNLGRALETQGKLDDAIAAYRKSIHLDPKYANAHYSLGNALMAKGWELANHPNPKLRDLKRVVEASKQGVELAPRSALAWQYLGWIQYREGNWEASIKALEKSCKLDKGGDCGQWIVMCATKIAPPLFILGIWRSGTTHLHNLLAQDDRFAYPNTYQVSFPATFLTTEGINARLVGFFVPRKRPMDNVAFGVAEPQEDEFAIAALLGGFSLAWAFPRRAGFYNRYLTLRETSPKELVEWKAALTWFLQKLTLKYEKPLVLKSPGHTCRIKVLLEMFPEARFVHIRRNPLDVFGLPSI